MKKKAKTNPYDIITSRIIALLEAGVVPWKKPWSGGGFPKNLISGRSYNGINSILLNCVGFESEYWLTFKQAKEKDGQVKKGEKGMPVVYWNTIKIKDATAEEEEKTIPFMKYYTVFNLQQIDGIEPPAKEKVENKIQPIEAAEQIVSNMPQKPTMTHSEQRAYYRSTTDTVNMPKMETFNKAEEYYSTLFHELIHSIGHCSRLDRKEVGNSFFGSADYSKEECLAEIGASFLCGNAGMVDTTIKNSASYINGWLTVLRKDKKFIIEAASKAQKAANFILGKKKI